MLTVQKEQIHTYRLQGWGYKRIAKGLHLTVDRVQRYCRKNGIRDAVFYVLACRIGLFIRPLLRKIL